MRPFIHIVLLLLSIPTFSQSESQEILNKHFEAIGQDQWDQIDDVTIDGRMVDKDYRGYSMDLWYKRPEKIRMQGSYGGRTFIEVTDGQLAWILAPWKDQYSVQPMNFQERILLENSLSLGSPLKNLNDKLRFQGLVDYEGTVYLTYVYEVQQGEDIFRRTFYLDRKNFMLYMETYEWGKDQHMKKVYEKYRNYGPLSIPTAVRFSYGNQERELIYDEVFIGLGIKNELFEKPKGR